MSEDRTHEDLHIKNFKILIEEGEFLQKFKDDPQFGKVIELMMMIINDHEYLPSILTIVSQCCAWDTELHATLIRNITVMQIKFGIGVSLGSKIELR